MSDNIEQGGVPKASDNEMLSDEQKEKLGSLEHYDLLEDQQSQEKIKEAIATNNGTVRIFIHPFFNRLLREKSVPPQLKDQLRPINSWTDKQENRLEDGIKRLVSSGESQPPIIIFEEDNAKNESLQLASDLVSKPKQPLYYVATHQGDPVSKIAGDLEKLPYGGYKGADEAWQLTAEFLEELGVKKIILGGQYLNIYMGQDRMSLQQNYGENAQKAKEQLIDSIDHNNPDLALSGCVFESYKQLFLNMGDIIEISNLTGPHSPIDIQRTNQGKAIRMPWEEESTHIRDSFHK